MTIDIAKIIEAAEAGGEVLRKYFGQNLAIEEKSMPSDFRTIADTESEKAILNILQPAFPQAAIFSEEIGAIEGSSDYRFIIDPLDGTNNFVIGVPNFSVSIGLVKGEEIQAAVIHHAVTKNTYHAKRGGGTYLGKSKLQVNSQDELTKSTVAHTLSYQTYHDRTTVVHQALYGNRLKRLLENWAPTLEYCMVASGRMEAILNEDNEIYDFVAGKLIMREAGAKITRLDGSPDDDMNSTFLATNGTKLHEEILKILAS